MRKVCSLLLLAAGMQLGFSSTGNAQSNTLTLKVPTIAIVIDGSAKDWGDTLSFYNPEKKVRYTIANDKDKLYLILKTKDAVQESNILGAGITFSIDTKGRKRLSFSTTFPSNGGNVTGNGETLGEEPLAQKKAFAGLLHFKKINVNGFKEIDEEFIGASNQYGIQVAIDYDDQGYLVYEESIPLELFHAGDLAKNEWSFNIKLNGLEKIMPAANSGGFGADAPDASSGGGKGSKGGGGSKGGSRSSSFTPDTSPKTTRITSEIDFWGKFMLAKTQ